MYEAPVSNVLVGLADAAGTSPISEVTTTTEFIPALLGDCV